jgi:hypothetical protein
MSKRKKITLRFALVLAIFIGIIATLEILSRTSSCSTSRYSGSMTACGNHLYTADVNGEMYLNGLIEKYSQGISPSQEELEQAVIEVDRDSIGGANGVYCSGVAFVSNDLPTQAKLYVRRHELEHAFQFTLQMKEENYESAANYAAAKEYPVGMVETVVFSVVESRKFFNSTTCWLVMLWKIFKIYFLPFAG